MARHLIELSPKEHRVTDDAGNVSDPLSESVFAAFGFTLVSGDLATVPLRPASPMDVKAIATATTLRST